ncbi:uncharacterized protein LOC143289930 [Babylonia areolata]|uniref:uncharacterized protein LOC143289930 n=1 Tax=Babylonia areolata TaxID=304850 RepID=UPI003FD6A136
MGCGRSRPRSPSESREGGAEACDGDNKDKEKDKRGGAAKEKKGPAKDRRGGKPGTGDSTTNGGTGDVKGNAARGGAAGRKQGVSGRDRQSGEPMGSPSGAAEVGGASKSPGRVALGKKPSSPSRLQGNFSLLNGGSSSKAGSKMDARAPTTADRVQTHASPVKPFHVTNSQQEFFKMLDEKIEKGPDYETDDD